MNYPSVTVSQVSQAEKKYIENNLYEFATKESYHIEVFWEPVTCATCATSFFSIKSTQ